jgi:hypothetical protein
MAITERGDEPADVASDGVVGEATTAPTRPRETGPVLLRVVRCMTRLTWPLAGRRFFPLWARGCRLSAGQAVDAARRGRGALHPSPVEWAARSPDADLSALAI